LENGAQFEKYASLQKMWHSWENAAHLKKVRYTWKNAPHWEKCFSSLAACRLYKYFSAGWQRLSMR